MRKMMIVCGLFAGALGLASLANGQVGVGRPGGGRLDPVQLLNNPSVKKELELTDEQSQALPEAVMKALGGVLSDKQMKRFKQIELQQRGAAAFSDELLIAVLDRPGLDLDGLRQIRTAE